MLSDAEKLLQQGTPEQALPLLAEYCASNADDARAWFLLGVCQHQTGKLEAALHTFERAISIEPLHLQARSAKGAVLCDQKERVKFSVPVLWPCRYRLPESMRAGAVFLLPEYSRYR